MGDLLYLEEYLAELPEEAAEAAEDKSSFLDSPQSQAGSPVNIVPGAKFEEAKANKTPDTKSTLPKLADATKKTDKALGALVPSVKDIPTPPTGGVGLLVFMALVVVFAITKAPGQDVTRLTLLWQAILGNYVYKSANGVTKGAKSSASNGGKTYMPGSGNFGTGGLSASPSSSPNNLGNLIQGGYTY